MYSKCCQCPGQPRSICDHLQENLAYEIHDLGKKFGKISHPFTAGSHVEDRLK